MRIHQLVVSALASFALTACTVGSTDPAGGGSGSPDAGPDISDADTSGSSDLSGSITDNAAWGGDVTMSAETIIESGVTVTVEPGTAFTAAQNAVLRVHGTLIVDGTESSPITLNPVDGAGGWGGIVVESGGKLTLRHATGANVATLVNCKTGAVSCDLDSVQFTQLGKAIAAAAKATMHKSSFEEMSNGGVSITAGGDLTITDSYLWTSTHDLVVQTGGTLLIDQSEIGGALQSYEHCDVHIGAADSFTLTNSNVVSAIYGMMLGGTDSAVITGNNFMDNDPNQDVSPIGTNTNVDLTGNYWDDGAPDLGPEYDTSSPAASEITTAGPTWQR